MRTPCFVFDIDGTIADMSHRLHHIVRTDGAPKDWDACFASVADDAPIAHMIDVARALVDSGHFIIFVSGRPDSCRSTTETWLEKHVVGEQSIYMRKSGDHRNDDIVKMELLAELRADGWEPRMVFDDRNRVVSAWRRAGIPCAQVAEGSF